MKPLNVIRSVKAAREDELLKLPGVTGADVGRKIVKGRKTDEIAIRVYVQKKKKTVPEKDRIPEEIDGIKTDVIEAKFVRHAVAAVPLTQIMPKADTGRYDPLVGGISIGPCQAVGGFVYTGTLGCIVRDRSNGEVLMLSNYHVMAEKWPVGSTMAQPSRVDTGTCPADVVGTLVRSVLSENVDGAVARITARGHNCSIEEIGPVNGQGTAAVDMAVRKRGRTTGLTYGTVQSVDLTVVVPYDDGDHTLKKQILIEVDSSQSSQFGNGGDSGSVVVDENGKVVGLYYAGTEDGSLGVANPIDVVLEELNIDLCTTIDEGPWKHFRDVIKNRFKEVAYEKPPLWEHVKDRFKEVAYEKPPAMERIDWDWLWQVLPPTEQPAPGRPRGEASPASVEQRLARLERLLVRRAGGIAPSQLIPKKTELKELVKEWWKEKPEIKEIKEKESKEKPELKELKDKEKEIKEKEFKEKPEPKELKDKEKEIKEKEFKEKPEPKELAESGLPGQPDNPVQPGPARSVEERLARLEALLAPAHFIGSHLRPDLSAGALLHEPDVRGRGGI